TTGSKEIFVSHASKSWMPLKDSLGKDYLSVVGWPRVNSGVASIFVENLLIIRPSKVDVVSLALHWLRPAYCGNLASEVVNCCLAFWVVHESFPSVSGVAVGVFSELKKWFGILLAFTEQLVVYARDRAANHARLVLPNLKTLCTPLDPILPRWTELWLSAVGAYDFLWLNWVNSEVKVEMEDDTSLGRVSQAASVAVTLGSGE
ncbi:hypothetical protein KI387_043662, partial [Taxus chinensis]